MALAIASHLLLTTRERAAHLVFSLFQPWKQLVHTLDILLDSRFIFSEVSTRLKIFQDGKLGKYLPPLQHL